MKVIKNNLIIVKEYITFKRKGDVAKLLKEICRISLQIEANMSIYYAMDKSKAIFYTYRQEGNKSNKNAFEELQEHCRGS